MDKYNDRICTPEQLRNFAFAEDNPTVFNFARWMKSKTDSKYTVIETKFITDVFDILAEQKVKSKDTHDEFREKYSQVIRYLL